MGNLKLMIPREFDSTQHYSIQAVIVIRFLAFFSPDKGGLTEAEAYSYGGALIVFLALYTISHHVIFVDLELTGMRIRVASCALIYREGQKYVP